MSAMTRMRAFMALGFAVLGSMSAHAQPANTESETSRLPPFVKPVPPDAPKPTADLRDLRGTWMRMQKKTEQLPTLEETAPPYTAASASRQKARIDATRRGNPFVNPAALCRTPGFIWDLGISYFPFRILQDDDELVVLFERFHAVWRIALNGKQTAKPEPTYMGHSVGRWEGDTLVVETVGLRDGLWLDEAGSFVSDAARITSRITKNVERSELQIVHTIDDPKTYTKPWSTRQRARWRPDYLVLVEHDCEETAGSVEEAREYGYQPE